MEDGVNVGGTDGGDGGDNIRRWSSKVLQAPENQAILRELAPV